LGVVLQLLLASTSACRLQIDKDTRTFLYKRAYPSHLHNHATMDTEGSDDEYHPTDALMIDTSDTRSDTPDTDIIVGNQGGWNLFFDGNLRSRLDDDEVLLDLPEMWKLVRTVARNRKLQSDHLQKSFRGQDRLTTSKTLSGRNEVELSSFEDFRPAAAITCKQGQDFIVWGRENKQHPDWLHVSFVLDTQMPKIVLRIRHDLAEDCHEALKLAQGDSEMTFVHIFATNITRLERPSITLQTGKDVSFCHKGREQVAKESPRLLEKVKENLITVTHIKFSHGSKGETDVDWRTSKPPVITGARSGRWALDTMRVQAEKGKKGQTPQEKFLGLLQRDGMSKLSLYTDYESENRSAEYPKEAAFCAYFKLIMVLCEQLGHFWAYRRQFPDISWKAASFPFSKLSPPQWMIKMWFKRSVSTAAEQTATPPRAAEWEPIKRPQVFPGDEEEAFVRGLDEAGRGFVSED
jgi:hypothetical protein